MGRRVPITTLIASQVHSICLNLGQRRRKKETIYVILSSLFYTSKASSSSPEKWGQGCRKEYIYCKEVQFWWLWHNFFLMALLRRNAWNGRIIEKSTFLLWMDINCEGYYFSSHVTNKTQYCICFSPVSARNSAKYRVFRLTPACSS